MKMNRTLVIASSLLSIAAIGCSSQPADEMATAEPLPTAQATSADGRPRLVAAARGEANLALLTPDAARQTVDGQAYIVTEIQVMNLEDAPIAGLTVEDLWYDGDGNTVSGDTYRHPEPLPPGEAITLTLEVPFLNAARNNQYLFSHANGEIVPVNMDAFPEPEIAGDETPAEAVQ
jgi:uncharacterized protein YcfL